MSILLSSVSKVYDNHTHAINSLLTFDTTITSGTLHYTTLHYTTLPYTTLERLQAFCEILPNTKDLVRLRSYKKKLNIELIGKHHHHQHHQHHHHHHHHHQRLICFCWKHAKWIVLKKNPEVQITLHYTKPFNTLSSFFFIF